jgi:hypothetical protein
MAYTYTGTPNQRIQQAQQRISNDGSVAINPTLSAYMQAAQQEQTEEQAVEQQNKANFGVRLGDTLGDVAKNTLDGMLKAGEGLLDFGAGAVGMFAGWFGNEDLKQRASDWTARDLVGEMWESGRQKGLDVDFEDSYINEMSETGQNIVRGVAQGVGQMLPMVAVTALTAGAGGAAAAAGKISATAAKGLAKAGQVANLVGLGASAAGTSTEQALNTDIVDTEGNVTRPTLDRAFLYGLASGAVEMATEKLVGGVFEKFTGTGLADKVINKLSKSVKFGKVVQFGLNIVGEGVEEMVSEAVGKTLETIYNSSDGKLHWESPDMQDVIVSGIVGSLTAAVMGGADVGVRKISPTQSVQDAMLDYENSKKKADNLQRQGKLTAEDIAKFDAENASTFDKISRRYQKASEKTRTKMLETMPGLADLLDIKDGSVKKSVLSDGATEITAQQATQAMSGSLAVSRRTEVANALHERNLSIATNLDEVQRANMSKLEKALKLTGKKSGVDLKVVVAESMPDNAHLDGDIMYISKDRLSSSDSTAQDFSHEAFHFAEGTKEYRAMYDFLRSIKLNGESLVDTAIDKVRNLGYEVDDTIYDKIKNRESLSGQDARQVELALSEINAKAAELLFGDAETIDKLVDRDRSLARKVLSNMRDYAKIIENVFKGEKDSVETLKQMRKGIKLFEDALAASGEDYLRGKSIEHQQEIRKQNNNTDKNETIVPQKVATQSSLRIIDGEQVVVVDADVVSASDTPKSILSILSNIVRTKFNRLIQVNGQVVGINQRTAKEWVFSKSANQLKNIDKQAFIDKSNAFNNADELLKASKNYIGEEQKHSRNDNISEFARGTVTFQVENRMYIADIIVGTTSKGSAVLYDIVNIQSKKTVASPSHTAQSRRSDVSATNNSIRQNSEKSTESDIKYSLREDSEGRILSKEQVEFFKNSKVVDGSGNLLVVYHGTPNGNFFTFEYDKSRQTGTDYGKAFYFTTNLKNAKGYAKDNHKDPRIKEYELKRESLKRQILTETDTAKRQELEKQFRNIKVDGKSILEILYDVDYDTGGEVRKVYLNLVNPLIADAQKKYHYEVYPELFKQAIKNGNDGIIVRNVDDSSKFGVGLSDVYIAFFPEQIKLTTNETPTANPDIRYSLRENATDSEGRKLSKKQLEFFKDSKVVDKDGNLLVVYHGTKSDFTIFDKSKGGESNSIADIGFWFTTSKQGAERWAENAWWGDNEQGKAMAAYLKIENPKIYETTDNDSKEVVLKERDLHQKRSKIASKYLYDIDRNNSTTGVAEWDAFRVIVENYDKKTQSFYLDKLSPDKRENVTRDAEEYKTIYAEEEELGKEISRLHFTRDGYEKFRADMYSLTGQSAEDANFNGNGFALKNAQETKELFVKQLKEQGYDGLIIHTDFDANSFGLHNTQYVVFDANQIKSIDNLNPTANPDIRYSLREKPIFNDKKSKTKLIERLDGMQLDYYGKYFAHIEDASKFFSEDTNADRLATQIIAMANQNDESVRYAYADDLSTAIINNMVVTDVDPQRLSDITGLSDAMRQYMHKLNLTADIMAEVKSKYGEKEARTIRLIWGSAKDASVKISVDDAASELQSRGYTFQSDNVADQFLEMLDVIEESRNLASRELSKTAKQLLSPEEYDSLQEEIRDDILSFMEENGTAKEWNDYVRSAEREANTILEQARQKAEEKTKLATLEAQLAEEKAKHAYDKQVKELEEKIRDIEVSAELRAADDIEYNKEYHRLVDKVWSEAVSLSADNLKKYNNASDLMNKEFASVVKKLAGIKYRGELKKGATRRIIADFGKWYNVNNPLLTGGLDAQTIEMMMNDASVENIGYLDKFTLNAIESISENQTREAKSGKYKGQKVENNKPLSSDELRLVGAVLGSARHVLKNYNTVEVNKKKIVLSDAAIKANKQAQAIAPHVKKHTRIGENVSNAIKSIIDPTALIGEMFGYQDNNPLVDSFKDIQEGATHAQYLTNSFTDIIDDFTKAHKSYKKHLADKIKVGGHEIRVDVALSLYMLSQQADSINGLKNGGWGYVDEKGYWIDCGKLTDSDISSLYDDFTKADKDFLKVARKFFDTTGKAMAETDVQYRGYTLINADAKSDYFPITRYSGDMSKPIADAEATRSAMQVSVANYSFTKERVKNERRITVSPILNVINKHAREVGNYCGLAIPIKEFQRIYNCNIGENGATKSIRNTINEQSWSGFNNYITTLLEDIQGISREKNSLANKALNLIRSNIATFALGFNIKTILSQISGYPAISMYVSLDSMAKAMAHSTWYKGTNAQNMFIYSEWAAVKAHDNGLILAETASEKLGKVANMTTVGIQMMDNWMNRLIWNACQCEVEKRTGLKFGTKENMVEAGKLHAEVGRMTQGNNARSELSAMQRSSNALAKMYSMFNSDGFKYISRLYEAAKRASAYKYLNKTNPGTISQQKVRSAHVFMAKAATAIIVSNLVYVLMGQLMKFALNKDREDEEGNEISFWQDLGMDFASSMVGMIPIVRDIYSLVVEGYDVKDNATEGIMNLAESIKDVIESSMTMIKGDVWDSTDIAKPLKSLIDAIGQVTGIPTRNVYNYVYGFTKRFSPSTAYEWNSIFYNNGYTKDLKKAMQKDDVDLQKTIIGLMLKDNGMTDTSEQVNNRLRELYAQGYTVLPRTVKDTLNYNGETYSLSKKQQTAFKATYGQANKEVEELIESRSFSSLSAEIQARAIKWIYDYYYENAVFETVGEDADSKNQLFGEVMDISRFAMTIAACKSVESKVDKKGNVIAGSKKQAILQLLQKLNLSNNEILMILAYLGYSIEGNEQAIKNFIGRIGLTRSQQKSLLKYCGIAA